MFVNIVNSGAKLRFFDVGWEDVWVDDVGMGGWMNDECRVIVMNRLIFEICGFFAILNLVISHWRLVDFKWFRVLRFAFERL